VFATSTEAMYIHRMARMVRKQIYIEPAQDEQLKLRAKLFGVTEAELIRQGINKLLGSELSNEDRHRLWEAEKDWIRKNRMMDVPQTGRRWTREELYEERLEHLNR